MKTLVLTLVLFSVATQGNSAAAQTQSQSALLDQLSGVYHILTYDGELADIDNMLYPGKYQVKLSVKNGCLVEEIKHAPQALIKFKDLTLTTCNKVGPTRSKFKWADDNQSALLSTSKRTDMSSFKIDVASGRIIINTGYTWSHSGLMALVIPSYDSGYNYEERIYSLANGQARYVSQSGHGEGKVRRAEDPKTVANRYLKVADEL